LAGIEIRSIAGRSVDCYV